MIAQKIAEQNPTEEKAVEQVNRFIETGEVKVGNEHFLVLTNPNADSFAKSADCYKWKFLDSTSNCPFVNTPTILVKS